MATLSTDKHYHAPIRYHKPVNADQVPVAGVSALPLKLRFPILDTKLLPTASTAPIGFIRLGPRAFSFSTLNTRIPVPFQTPTVPFCTTISEANIKDQRSDSYQPSESGDHSKRWIRGGEGSICGGMALGGVLDDVLERKVSTVWRGSDGSQESIFNFISHNWFRSSSLEMTLPIAPKE